MVKEKSLGQLRSAYPVPHFFLLLQPLRINQVLKATFLSSLSFTGRFGGLSFNFVLGRLSPFSDLTPRSRGTAALPLVSSPQVLTSALIVFWYSVLWLGGNLFVKTYLFPLILTSRAYAFKKIASIHSSICIFLNPLFLPPFFP